MDIRSQVSDEILESVAVKRKLTEVEDEIAEAATAILRCLKNGGKLVVVGKGGSAADAQHIVAELVGLSHRAEGVSRNCADDGF